MVNNDYISTAWGIVQKIAVVGLLALVGFCWKINAKVESISDNKEAIAKVEKECGEGIDKLEDKYRAQWNRYSEISDEVKLMAREIGEVKTEIKHLNKKHDN